MKEKINQLSLILNVIDPADLLALNELVDQVEAISGVLSPKHEDLAKLMNVIHAYTLAAIKGIVEFSVLSENLISFIALITSESVFMDNTKTIIKLTKIQQNRINDLIKLFPLLQTDSSSDEVVEIASIDFEEENAASSKDTQNSFSNDRQIFIDFIGESREHLSQIEEHLMDLEKNPHEQEDIEAVFRAFHTIKGVTGFLQLTQIGELTHKTESVLEKIKTGKLEINAAITNVLLNVRDILFMAIALLDENVQKGILKETLQDNSVILAQLEQLMAGELISIDLPRIEKKEIVPLSVDTEKQKSTESSDNSIKINADKIDHLINITGELLISQSLLWNDDYILANHKQSFINHIDQIKRVTKDMQRISLSMRMVTIKQMFSKMRRIIRDVADKTKKEVTTILVGEDIELDRTLVEAIHDPLMHIVRNAVDHGIEALDLRQQRGKPDVGTILLRAFYSGANVMIEISDDGAGLNKERIVKKAIEVGLITESTPIDEQTIYQLIFAPGFSTAEVVTDISGRGVGMNVVKKNLERIRGKIDVSTREGEGTTILLQVPLTLAIISGMLIRVDSEIYILPVLSILDILKPTENQIHAIDQTHFILLLRGKTIPIIKLDEVLHQQIHGRTLENQLIIVVEYNKEYRALVVDEILGNQEIVIKSLQEEFNQRNFFSSCSILGNGKASLILNVESFFK